MDAWDVVDIRAAIASGERPARDLARAIAALSEDDEQSLAEAIGSGWQYWAFATSRNYWCSWKRGDMGTMACGKGPISVDVAWDQLREQGVLPASWHSTRRTFVVKTACFECGAATPGHRKQCTRCGHALVRVVAVNDRPLSVDDCAVMAADPDTIAHVEDLARGLAGNRDSRVAWRMLPPATLAQALGDLDLERQWIVLEHGYAIDPLAVWDEGVVLTAPSLGE